MNKFGIQVILIENPNEIEELKKVVANFDYKRMKRLFSTLKFPITIVYESYYVDKLFRDTYYTYFSSKHFEISRRCERLTLFEGEFFYEDFYEDSLFSTLQEAIIGTIVLRPTITNVMGRTLLDPGKIRVGKMYVRTTEFEISLLGKIYKIQAYPFLSQDTETMTCAETSIWTMLEYYGTRYPEYRTVLPSEILDELGSLSAERVLPSHGMDFRQKSSLLKRFGFHPRVYTKSVYQDDFRKLFHYYVESGIPITLSLPGHSVVCIGHAAEEYNIEGLTLSEMGKFQYADSSSFIKKYVIIDDNQIPYSLEKYDQFSVFQKEMTLFTVPLYKRIFLEVNDASSVFEKLLWQLSILIEWYIGGYHMEYDRGKNPLVKRIFLTSSRKYKAVRTTDASNMATKKFYSEMLMPKFIWVCEISTYNDYQKGKMFGEIVLDATASRYEHINSTIMVRIGDVVGYRMPNEDFAKLVDGLKHKIRNFDTELRMYHNNLKGV